MCSERNPLDCHRCLLVGRHLAKNGIDVEHILFNGSLASHSAVEDQLLELSGKNRNDLFAQRSELLAHAYREQMRKVAFVKPDSEAAKTRNARRSA